MVQVSTLPDDAATGSTLYTIIQEEQRAVNQLDLYDRAGHLIRRRDRPDLRRLHAQRLPVDGMEKVNTLVQEQVAKSPLPPIAGHRS